MNGLPLHETNRVVREEREAWLPCRDCGKVFPPYTVDVPPTGETVDAARRAACVAEGLYADLSLYRVGETVRAFDPRTLGVVKTGTVLSIGRKYLTIDFGMTGTARVTAADMLGHA